MNNYMTIAIEIDAAEANSSMSEIFVEIFCRRCGTSSIYLTVMKTSTVRQSEGHATIHRLN